jgi:hypothetical protein
MRDLFIAEMGPKNFCPLKNHNSVAVFACVFASCNSSLKPVASSSAVTESEVEKKSKKIENQGPSAGKKVLICSTESARRKADSVVSNAGPEKSPYH